MGRKYTKVYKDRTVDAIALPKAAFDKVEEIRGHIPRSRFYGMIVCKYLGIEGVGNPDDAIKEVD